MIKFLSTLFAFFIVFSNTSKAQFTYTLSHKTDVYTPLSGATSISGGVSWNKKTKFSVPIGFSFKIGSTAVSNFSIVAGKIFTTDTVGDVAGFMLTDADILSKGISPISYEVTGTAPNRIFKAEVYNAGFEEEQIKHGTFNDYIDMQIWLYETSNIVEIRTGPYMVTYSSDYFHYGMPIIGYATDYNADSDMIYNMYMLAGNPIAPTIDSINKAHGDTTQEALLLYPAQGMVYTFTPRSLAVKNLNESTAVSIYPSICRDDLFIDGMDAGETNYQVINLSGQKTNLSGILVAGNNKLDVSQLAVGAYFLRLQNAANCITYKFVKI